MQIGLYRLFELEFFGQKRLAMTSEIGNTHKTDSVLFENLIGYKELSNWLSIPERTLQDWVYKRKIPFVKVQGLIRFIPSEIQAWIQERG